MRNLNIYSIVRAISSLLIKKIFFAIVPSKLIHNILLKIKHRVRRLEHYFDNLEKYGMNFDEIMKSDFYTGWGDHRSVLKKIMKKITICSEYEILINLGDNKKIKASLSLSFKYLFEYICKN
ncbi:hypothetical protein BpHYR1_032932 [Brachionus plicatilis]|uniref:Uncharacterized protein n=1 Tax=Brachionus plicatilis TaxID=10195 RepID=A0A3M7SVZ8_BRAPC|nr:hypothetical protein BpHYR1_032932 [Brachionus plicatilis]